MAILKHLSVKNAAYQKAVTYFMFQHDEHGRPVRNERGCLVLREHYLIDGINTSPATYGIDCAISNRSFGKNQKKADVKSHHFILSFDPKDVDECGLTLEKAQEIGMNFARKHFAGHQVIVSAHEDGHNGSGNIHVHFSVNSLRVNDIDQPVYSQFARDRKAGFKLHTSKDMIRYLKEQVMELCEQQRLHQVELIKPAKKRVTDREYRAGQRGQRRLDKQNQRTVKSGGTVTTTKFQTELEKIRVAITDAKRRSTSVEQFKTILKQEYNIEVTESRGRWSYLSADRQKPISWRKLGEDFRKEVIEGELIINARNAEEKQRAQSAQRHGVHGQTVTSVFVASRIIDLSDPKIQQSYGLSQWANLRNLQETSRRFNFLTENGLLNLDKLEQQIISSKMEYNDNTDRLKQTERRLKEVNLQLRLLGQYYKTKAVYAQYKGIKQPQKQAQFREDNITPILLHEGAVKQLREYQLEHRMKAFPPMKELQAEKITLTERKEKLYQERRTAKDQITVMADASKKIAARLERENPNRQQKRAWEME